MKQSNERDKKKFAKYLASGEELVAVIGISDRYFYTNLFYLSVLSIMVIGLPFLGKLLHLKHGRKYILTNRRVLVRTGIFSTELTSAPLNHIARITVKENFLHKISYQMGDVIMQTTGPTPVEIHLVNVYNPIEVKNLIEELMVLEKGILHHKEISSPLVKPL